MLGTHVPRQCGLATFTADLKTAVKGVAPELDCFALAMNDVGRAYPYDPAVRFEISEADLASYRRAADFLNVNAVDVLCVQHEYGIFGGKAGSHVLTLLRELRMPVVTTLHTLLTEPTPHQRAAMDELVQLSERLVVMTARGAAILRDVHRVPADKIDLIPHGIPSVPFDCADKDRLGVAGKRVLLTFGLLSPDKGIEHVIDALPAILERHPDTVYIVLGVTHPHVKEHHGELYRLGLESRAQRLGVASSTVFHNRFVSLPELIEFLSAADIYITPYLKPEQTTSGTLAYAVGSGRAVISTPYWHAQELLADGRGVLVPWRDAPAIAREVNDLLGDDAKRLALRRRAATHSADAAWPVVGRRYLESFERALSDHARRPHTLFEAKPLARQPVELPDVNLDHLSLMTDDSGLLQHAVFSVPRLADGYCLDDNARALLLMALLEGSGGADRKQVRALASRYLGFVTHAFNNDSRRFRNFFSYSRTWLEAYGSEDCHGRALWALGTVVGRAVHPGRQSQASALFHAALPVVRDFKSPRAWAYALLGIDAYLDAFEGDSTVQSVGKALSARLLELLVRQSSPDWPWFEPSATYANARLPQALIASGRWLGDEQMAQRGLGALRWLEEVQRSEQGYYAPIGSDGFWSRGGPRAVFDQQPIEACAMVSACLEAGRTTGDAQWARHARRAFNWLIGENQLQQSLYDPSTGGCRDGLQPGRLNPNQGAESTLSFLMALCELQTAAQAAPALPRGSRGHP
jgi:glycosyltransferase involved in cell wall biosynthesis